MKTYRFKFKTNAGTIVEFCACGTDNEEALTKILKIQKHVFEYTNKTPVECKELVSYKNSNKRPANFIG